MEDWRSAFAEEWDAVVMGTGMKECLLSGLLSVAGKKVLHVDRNNYYGGASASLDIQQLFGKFAGAEQPNEAELGKLRDYAVDMVPKFIMAGGQLVKVLIHTGVANYMEFKPVDGSYVFRKSSSGGKIYKVPTTPKEAMKSGMLGMVEKGRMAQFTAWVDSVKLDDRASWVSKGVTGSTKVPLDTMSGADFFKFWKLETSTVEFLTHACALYRDEGYLQRPAFEIVERMKLYLDSMLRFPGMTSPYLYTLYGLGELPQAFARLAAVHGGTYMLNRDLDGTPVFGPGDLTVEYDGDGGAACGVKVQEAVARTKIVIADPSYFPQLCVPVGKVVRAIALLNKPIEGAGDCDSFQVIFPAAQVARRNDLYLFCCGAGHKVAPVGRYVAFMSTTVETVVEGESAQQTAARELAAGLQMLGGAVRIFFDVYDLMKPAKDGVADKVFISESFDATTHFETAISDVLAMYKRIVGKDIVLTDGPQQ
mmetsp:Transcript_22873/g.46587  ORF Transcript_22873/g.46587 Transcript_22873/m.46587 type:complete len:479 (-) Transcript_22873:22-1458(-)